MSETSTKAQWSFVNVNVSCNIVDVLDSKYGNQGEDCRLQAVMLEPSASHPSDGIIREKDGNYVEGCNSSSFREAVCSTQMRTQGLNLYLLEHLPPHSLPRGISVRHHKPETPVRPYLLHAYHVQELDWMKLEISPEYLLHDSFPANLSTHIPLWDK